MGFFPATPIGSGKGGSGKAKNVPSAPPSGGGGGGSGRGTSGTGGAGGGSSQEQPQQQQSTGSSFVSAQQANIQATAAKAAERQKLVNQLMQGGYSGTRASLAADALIEGRAPPVATQAERQALTSLAEKQRESIVRAQSQAEQAQFEENVQKVQLKYGISGKEAAAVVRAQVPQGFDVSFTRKELMEAQASRRPQTQVIESRTLPAAGFQTPQRTLQAQKTVTTKPLALIPFEERFKPLQQGKVEVSEYGPTPFVYPSYLTGQPVPYQKIPTEPKRLGANTVLLGEGTVEGYGKVRLVEVKGQKKIFDAKGNQIESLQSFIDAGGNLSLIKTDQGTSQLILSGAPRGYSRSQDLEGKITYEKIPTTPSKGVAGYLFTKGEELQKGAGGSTAKDILGQTLQGAGVLISERKQLAKTAVVSGGLGAGLGALASTGPIGESAALLIAGPIVGFGIGKSAGKIASQKKGERVQTFVEELGYFGVASAGGYAGARIGGATVATGKELFSLKKAPDVLRGEITLETGAGATGEFKGTIKRTPYKGFLFTNEPGTIKTATKAPVETEIVLASKKGTSLQSSLRGEEGKVTFFEKGKKVTSPAKTIEVNLEPFGQPIRKEFTLGELGDVRKIVTEQPIKGSTTKKGFITVEETKVLGKTVTTQTAVTTPSKKILSLEYLETGKATPLTEEGLIALREPGTRQQTFLATQSTKRLKTAKELSRELITPIKETFEKYGPEGLSKSILLTTKNLEKFKGPSFARELKSIGEHPLYEEVRKQAFLKKLKFGKRGSLGSDIETGRTKIEPQKTELEKTFNPKISFASVFTGQTTSNIFAPLSTRTLTRESGRLETRGLGELYASFTRQAEPTRQAEAPRGQQAPQEVTPRFDIGSLGGAGSAQSSLFQQQQATTPEPEIPLPPPLSTPFTGITSTNVVPAQVPTSSSFNLPFLNIKFPTAQGGLGKERKRYVNELQIGLKLLQKDLLFVKPKKRGKR